jgi:Tol biopolymer transport system component
MSLPDREITQLTDHPNNDYHPRISPDGKKIVFARSREPGMSTDNQYDWNTIMLNLETGEETFIHDFGNFPTWSADGRRIYFQFKMAQLGEYDLETGKPRIVFPRGHGDVHRGTALQTPNMGPDGERMAVTLRFEQNMTALVDMQGRIKPVSNGCQITWSPEGDFLYFVKPAGRMKNAMYVYEFGTPKPREWFDMPGEFSHEYFPKLSDDGRWLVFGASRSEKAHAHDRADFENFLWQVGTPIESAMRLTFSEANDNYPDIHVY